MDAYDPATVFSSIDHGGRYAYGNQPLIAHWNLARLGEAMLPLFADEVEPAIEAANGVLRHRSPSATSALARRHAGQARSAGLTDPGDGDLARDLLDLMQVQRLDITSCLPGPVGRRDRRRHDRAHRRSRIRTRSTPGRRAGVPGSPPRPGRPATSPPPWIAPTRRTSRATTSSRMPSPPQRAATSAPYEQLLEVVTQPFDTRPDWQAYTEPAPPDSGRYRTFCGT